MKRVVLIIVSALICGTVFTSCGSDKAEAQEENFTLKVGETTEIILGEVANNKQYGISLRVESINDSRCPLGGVCVWQGNALVQLHLKTSKGNYDFTLNTLHDSSHFNNEEIIEGLIYRLIDVLPYPDFREEQPIKTIKIMVDN